MFMLTLCALCASVVQLSPPRPGRLSANYPELLNLRLSCKPPCAMLYSMHWPVCRRRTMELSTLTWTARLSLLRNRLIFKQTLLVFGIAILALGLLIFLISEENRWLITLQVMGITTGIIAGLLVIVVGLLALIGYEQQFVLDTTGVRSTLSGRTKLFFRTVRIASLLSGQVTAMGSGLVMRTSDHIRWQDVERVEVDRQQRVLTLYRKRGAPFLLVCGPEQFNTVCAIVQQQTGLSVG
ncbi:MAG TPA: hypothetical protein DEF43_12850 [Chloroflexus aurantiacus]|uniref:Uncharacterized protein n=2 Tax=Chloroflexaceae TaxID=1106 RepID=A9WKA3_CHLAA|nr:hypothetical protein Caur_2779 [Chloroflexus aurantiacus J-10-fl]RMG50064.1 MAG: hypothetical protein D6716_09620 [Chloroflexota bacterium]HBW68025.1 hypothetical protein [Chloroflexus aurantiacus]